MTKSADAAASSRFSMSGQGVSRSERLTLAKSCIRGAPSRAAAAQNAGTPGRTSKSTPSRALAPGKCFTTPVAVNSGTDQLRKFFNAPSIVQEIGPIEYVYIGTGDREDPTRTTVVNQFYAVKNTWPATWSDATNTILSSSLVDLTSDTLQDSSASTAAKAAVTAALDTGAGWRIDMEHSGEKVVSSPVVFDKVVYFTTFTPSAVSGSGDKCSSNTASGTARLYAMDYKTGVSVVDWDNDDTLEKSDRSVVIGGGIPSEPVVVVTESGVQLMIGTQGGVKTIDLEYDNDFCRYYWREL